MLLAGIGSAILAGAIAATVTSYGAGAVLLPPAIFAFGIGYIGGAVKAHDAFYSFREAYGQAKGAHAGKALAPQVAALLNNRALWDDLLHQFQVCGIQKLSGKEAGSVVAYLTKLMEVYAVPEAVAHAAYGYFAHYYKEAVTYK